MSFYIIDWVFKVPHEYDRCDFSEEECNKYAQKIHEFSRFVDAVNTLEVKCTAYNPEDTNDNKKLPDWEWKVQGKYSVLVMIKSLILRVILQSG